MLPKTRTGVLLCCLLIAAVNAGAQSITGTLTGTVADAAGATVPNATVLLTNQGSRDIRRTSTNAAGYFTIAAVPAGTYDLSVEAPGFQAYTQSGIAFSGADKRNVDVQLQVGTATERIEVISAQDVVAPVDSGEKANLLNTKDLQDFSAVGRSAAEFIRILPGMAQTGNGVKNSPGFDGQVIGINGNGDAGHQSALGYYAANGTPTDSMEITADGAHVSDPGCNCATPVNPNTDMIQEMKVLMSNFSAENSKGPVVINTITKAGSTDFHGMGYLYARHNVLSSNDWLDNARSVQKPANKFFFPGGNIGGPVLIPGTNFNKNHDKLFFFTGFEYYYQGLDTGQVTASVPTEAMRNGDFSAAAIAALGPTSLVPGNPKPVNPSQFPNGAIPSNQFDPGGKALMNVYPLPNADPFQTGGYNFVKKIDFNQNGYQWLSRVDYSLSDNTKLFVRYNLQNELQKFPVMLWWRANPNNMIPYPTGIDSPNQSQSVSADLTHVFSPSLTNEFVFGYTYINFPNRFEDPSKVDRTALGYPYQGIFHNGVSQIPNVQGGQPAWIINPGGFEVGGSNLFAIKHLASFNDILSKVVRTHTLKFGAYFEYVINNQPSNNDPHGDLTFDIANPDTSGNAYADMLLGRVNKFTQWNYNVLHNEAYRLFEFFAQDSWKVTRRLSIDFGMRFSHLGQWYDRQGLGFAVWDPSTYTSDPKAYFPGVAWNKRNGSVPLSGYPTRPLFFSPRFGMAWDIFGTGRTVIRGGWGAYRYHTAQSTDGLDIPTGAYQASIPKPSTLPQIDQLDTPQQDTFHSSLTLVNRDVDEQPLTISYSFTISQRVTEGALIELAYVGNESKYLWENVFHNTNAVPYGRLLSVPNAGSADYNLFRPLSYYQDINIATNDAYANYNAFQLNFKHQRGRFNYLFNYTYSKALGLATNQRGIGGSNTIDKLNIDQNYGPLPFDRRHIFNAAFSVEMGNPVRTNAIVKGLVNGWQLTGGLALQSGANLQLNTGNGNFGISLPAGVSNRTIVGTESIQVQPILTCDPRSNLGEHQYINPSCFALPTPGNNGPVIMPEMFGPGFFNMDLSVFKNFSVGESRKLQFRFSGYNFLNHPVYSFGNDSNLNLTFGPDGTVNNPNFGTTTNKIGRRIIQLAVKFYF
jgi:Carboxypeptidase regulatory-like domain